MRLQLSRCAQLWPRQAVLVGATLVSFAAQADEASDTWTGDVDLRFHYYWERSTRVMAPAVGATLETPAGTELKADYLVDAITSASLATGTITDTGFTELRHQVGFGAEQPIDLGDAQLRLGAATRISWEPDYFARAAMLNARIDFNRRASALTLSSTYANDALRQVLRVDGQRSDQGRVGTLQALVTSASLQQVLTPRSTMTLGYDLVHNWGFLQNPYRYVIVAGTPRPETHPGQRTRHVGHARLAVILPGTATGIHLLYRAYLDDWKVGAINPEVAVYQPLSDIFLSRLRYRYYRQTRAYFYRNQSEYEPDAALVSADPKMSPFDSHLVGLHLRVNLLFLRDTALSFLEAAAADISFDYLIQNNRFGNAVLSQAGLSAPF